MQRKIPHGFLLVGLLLFSACTGSQQRLSPVTPAGFDSLAARAPGTLDAWGTLTAIDPSAQQNELYGIAAVTPSDAWSVGGYNQKPPPNVFARLTLAEHWNGSTWTIVTTPNPPNTDQDELLGIDHLASNDVWAVGFASNVGANVFQTLAMRWNGSAWSIVQTPNPLGTTSGPNELIDVAQIASNDAWAVGGYYNIKTTYPKPATVHWDGAKWTDVSNGCGEFGNLNGVKSIAPGDVWAVGDEISCHYDGTSWTNVPIPHPGGFNFLYDVAGVASNDVWAVGYYQIETISGAKNYSFALHWNGAGWQRVPAPGSLLRGVVALASNDVWAVGATWADEHAMIVHWDGRAWNRVPSPQRGFPEQLNDVSAVNGTLWADGFSYVNGGPKDRTLVAQAPSSTQGGVQGRVTTNDRQPPATVTWIGRQNGSTSTDVNGNYYIGALPAGQYSITVTIGNSGCRPQGANVQIVAGQVLTKDFSLHCP